MKYRVSTILGSREYHSFETDSITEAIKVLVSRRFNAPNENHTLFDENGFIVPGSEIDGFVKTLKKEALRMVSACELWDTMREAGKTREG